MLENTFITISRQYGSGGNEIAEIVASKLQIRCYEREILNSAAQKLSDGEGDIENIIEDSYKIARFSMALICGGLENVPNYNKMYTEQAKIILEIAKKGSAVFAGRCADVILKGHPRLYTFFIYADDNFRTERGKKIYDKTLKELNFEDKQRERYYNFYTGQKWGDPQNYDLMINTGSLDLEDAADLIIDYVSKRQKRNG